MQNWIFEIRSRPFFLLALLFVIVTIIVHSEITKEFDQSTIIYFDSISGDPGFDLLMQSITEIGDLIYMLIFGIALIIIRRTRRIGITIMILLVISTILV